MKLATFFVSKTKQIYTKTLAVPGSVFKIKAILACTLFEIVLTSAVICKQRFLRKNEIMKYLQNCK